MVTSTRLWLLLVLGIGLIVGLIAFANLEIINPDGVLYIYQAKAVYRQISATIRQSSHADGVVEGAGSRPLFINESFFYANTATADPVCHQSFNVDANSMSELLTQMKSQGIDYFLWETGALQYAASVSDRSAFLDAFDTMGHWQHEDTVDLALFRRKPAS